MVSVAMAAAGPFGMERMTVRPSNASIESSTKPDFVQRVGMDAHLVSVRLRLLARTEAPRGGAPVFVTFDANRPRLDLFNQAALPCPCPLPRMPR